MLTPLMKIWDRYLAAESIFEEQTSQLLKIAGWEYTCEVGSLWLYKRTVNGNVIYLTKDSALQYTRIHDEIWAPQEHEV